MPADLDNAAVAQQLEAFASLLDVADASPYTARAYRRAAETIRSTPAPILALAREGRARELRGIGPGIGARLRELAETGTIAELDELRREVRPELVAFGRLVGISAKRMVEIARTLDISTPDELRGAARSGALRRIRGIGPTREAELVERLSSEPSRPTRGLTLYRARGLTAEIAAALGGEIAGDARRWADLSFDLAVVVSAQDARPVLVAFEALPQIVSILERGERRAVGVTIEGVPITLSIPEPSRLGTELVRHTGSAAYVAALEPLPDAADEASVYRLLDIPWCPPELREEPFRGQPPPLVELGAIRGDLHCHTTWSDGRATVREMAVAARDRGYAYLAICDHTRAVRVVPGLDAEALRRQGEEVDVVNEELAPFRVLKGIEVDILGEGGLDLPDDALGALDWVQLSLHAGQRERGDRLTAKVTEAMRHPAVRCLSHPKGRILNHRPPNALNLDAVFDVAAAEGVALEVNGLPDRLDLDAAGVRLAVEAGVPLVVSTDAHSVRGLDNMQLAVSTARRGGAAPTDVLNTGELPSVLGLRRPG